MLYARCVCLHRYIFYGNRPNSGLFLFSGFVALDHADVRSCLNRLNVSITRAQAKCIVLLPRPLLEPSFDLLANSKAAEGLAFMQALVDYCAVGSDGLEASLGLLDQGDSANLKAWGVSVGTGRRAATTTEFGQR